VQGERPVERGRGSHSDSLDAGGSAVRSEAAKAGQKTQLAAALKAWYGNAHQIAAFLTRANPQNWPLRATTKMMNDHLKFTTQEAVAHLQGRWRADVAAYDKVHREILMMAGTLSSGIIKQFPNRF
jgi:hypothetical protein